MKKFLIALITTGIVATASTASAGIVAARPADDPFCKANPKDEACPYNFVLPAEQNPEPRRTYSSPVDGQQPAKQPTRKNKVCSTDGQWCNSIGVIKKN